MATSEGTGPALLVELGGRSWRFSADQPGLIGRGAECDVVVDDPRVSRRHLELGYADGWLAKDLDSTHGTWCDGQRLLAQPLDGSLTVRLADRVTVVLRSANGIPHPPRQAAAAPQRVTIGRALDNDVVLNDVLVSRHHVRLEQLTDGWRLTDLGSRNPTLVNGVPVHGSTTVAEGDRLTLGSTEIKVSGGDFRPVPISRARLLADDVSYSVDDKSLLHGVNLDIGPGELIAVVGPSGAGKSTLLKVLTGQLRPTGGEVGYDGYDVHDQFDAVRARIGVVPQDDVVHTRLTPRQALAYAALLRLPEDVGARERRQRVDSTLAELGLADRADLRIDRLSGGQRKRVSMALELLTAPSLLFLDEPTSGLDPGLDRQIMGSLRAIADAGRSVVVVTHNVNNLEVCDRVLLLAPGGIPVFQGAPSELRGQFGTSDWADVFQRIALWPQTADQPSRSAPGPRRPAAPMPVRRAAGPTLRRQVRTLAARHLRLILADPGYAAFLAVVPIALAALALAVPGHGGLREFTAASPGEAGQLLVLMFVGAAFMGGAAAAREVVAERAILLRERATGLRPVAYALAKAGVFGVICAVQAGLLVGAVVITKPGPQSAVLLGHPAWELAVDVWCTAMCSCLLGLLGSALVRTAEQVMPVLVVTVMAQLVLCGGMIPVTGRLVLTQLSWLSPARWGYAAGAATVDLRRLDPIAPVDRLWTHSWHWWLLSVAVLLGYGALCLAVLVFRLSEPRRNRGRKTA